MKVAFIPMAGGVRAFSPPVVPSPPGPGTGPGAGPGPGIGVIIPIIGILIGVLIPVAPILVSPAPGPGAPVAAPASAPAPETATAPGLAPISADQSSPAAEATAAPQPSGGRPAPIVLPARPAGAPAPLPGGALAPGPAPVLGSPTQAAAPPRGPAPTVLPYGGANLWIPPVIGLVFLSAGTMLRRLKWLWERAIRILGPVDARALSLALSVCGVIMIVSPAAWISYTGRAVNAVQAQALASWQKETSRVSSRSAPAAQARQASYDARMVLTIPRLGVRRYVPEDSTPEYLKRYGVGRIPWTALPDGEGVVGIAGHRTTHGAPFFRLDALSVGDVVQVDYRGRRYVYRVQRFATVRPTQVEVLQGSRTIALVTCTPAYSAAYRLVVLGSLETVTTVASAQ